MSKGRINQLDRVRKEGWGKMLVTRRHSQILVSENLGDGVPLDFPAETEAGQIRAGRECVPAKIYH